MKIAYKEHRFQHAKLRLIEIAGRIIEEYTAKGYNLTLRQVYYQLVARDIIPNNEKSYDNLGVLISNARLAGLISWRAIEDRTRNLRGASHWATPGGVIRSAASSYNMDKWVNQEYRVEVWVEKDALVDVVGRACGQLDLNYFSCRGYVSQSEMWEAAQRLIRYQEDGQTPVIIHLGDHDPSGIDMSRDIQERLAMFEAEPIFERVALNMDQVEQYGPPPNPAKITDSRANGYIKRFGGESWELDALQPEVINQLITDTTRKYMDVEEFNEVVREQETGRVLLNKVSQRWDEVAEYIETPKPPPHYPTADDWQI